MLTPQLTVNSCFSDEISFWEVKEYDIRKAIIFLDSRTLTNDTADSLANSERVLACELERENLALKVRVVELEQLVTCDTLTPAYNRRHFMAELNRWCWRKHVSGGEYELLFVDVDNLKVVND